MTIIQAALQVSKSKRVTYHVEWKSTHNGKKKS